MVHVSLMHIWLTYDAFILMQISTYDAVLFCNQQMDQQAFSRSRITLIYFYIHKPINRRTSCFLAKFLFFYSEAQKKDWILFFDRVLKIFVTHFCKFCPQRFANKFCQGRPWILNCSSGRLTLHLLFWQKYAFCEFLCPPWRKSLGFQTQDFWYLTFWRVPIWPCDLKSFIWVSV